MLTAAKPIWANIAHTSGAKIYSMLTSVLILAMTARLLGPEGRGYIAAIITWVGLFSTVAHLSLGQVALHRMAGDVKNSGFGGMLGTLMLIAVCVTLVCWLVALTIYWQDWRGMFSGLPPAALIVGFIALPFLIWEQYGSSLLMGLGRIRIYNRYQMVGRTLSMVSVIVLVGWLGQGVVAVMQASLLGQVVVALGGLGFLTRYARRNHAKCRPSKAEAAALLSGGAKLHLNAIGVYLFTSVNILMLNHFHGAEQTAYYQLAAQLTGLMMIIPSAACMVMYGEVARVGADEAWPANKRLLTQLTLGMILLGVCAAVLAPWAIVLVAGEPFRPAIEPFQLMLLGVVGMSFSTLMSPQWIGRGYFWQTAVLTLLVGIVNFMAGLWLIPLHGINGAICAFLGTWMFAIVGNGSMFVHCEMKAKRKEALRSDDQIYPQGGLK